MKPSTLDQRIKSYEKSYESKIEYDKHIVVRIDGHKFSKFTKGFIKPFDKILSNAMEKTTIDLVEKFGAVTGYTQSDEISLVIPPSYTTRLKPIDFSMINGECVAQDKDTGIQYRVFEEIDSDEEYTNVDYNFYVDIADGELVDSVSIQYKHSRGYNDTNLEKLNIVTSKYYFFQEEITNSQIFGGRIQKMSSLFSAFTTARFNKHLSNEFILAINKATDESDTIEVDRLKSLADIKVGEAWFDARIFGVPDDIEAYNTIMWRNRDAEKNSISMFAQSHCSHKSLLNKNGAEQIEFCLNTTGKDWNDIDDRYKFGITVKKEEYEKAIPNPLPSFPESVTMTTRTRTVTMAVDLTDFSEDNVDLVLRRLK